ncbi:hypothetical protein NKR23_g5275 [Pleurostoma richardsiae]|uniref:Uncharacterized protein n=1 Tax=Pleurostoma richardsiae TaxID=41990 RepID=A0AA38RH88_9PEZI|nr:hypothetical protein NKR23_g5275 [Pleurostoma richardsiae]
MHERNTHDILRYVNLQLMAEWEDRNRTVTRIGEKARGMFLWAEIVVNMLNVAIGEGASQDLIEDMIAELPMDLEGLYGWMLGSLNQDEKAETLVLLQWVILASETLRLNDLRIAVRLTKAWSLEELKPPNTLNPGPPTSIRELRKPISGSEAFDTPYHFHRWVKHRSIGLVQVNPEAQGPTSLQRVQVIHESVRAFFLSGRGFTYLVPGDIPRSVTARDLVDHGHYALLHACLTYLAMADFDSLGRGNISSGVRNEESKYWRDNVRDQRSLVMSSYPFLQYAVENLFFHLLSPRQFRYFVPQQAILKLMVADGCRLWKRWTSLFGESDPDAILSKSYTGSCRDLLDPVFGARYRLVRVMRKIAKITQSMSASTPKTPRSTCSEKTFFVSPSYAAFTEHWHALGLPLSKPPASA